MPVDPTSRQPDEIVNSSIFQAAAAAAAVQKTRANRPNDEFQFDPRRRVGWRMVNLHATRFPRIVRVASTEHSVANKGLRVSERLVHHETSFGRCGSEEKVITDEFPRTSRLDEAINAQRGIATPSSAFLAVFVRAGRNPYYSSIFASSPFSRGLSLSLFFSPPRYLRTVVLSSIFAKLLRARSLIDNSRRSIIYNLRACVRREI